MCNIRRANVEDSVMFLNATRLTCPVPSHVFAHKPFNLYQDKYAKWTCPAYSFMNPRLLSSIATQWKMNTLNWPSGLLIYLKSGSDMSVGDAVWDCVLWKLTFYIAQYFLFERIYFTLTMFLWIILDSFYVPLLH